MSSDEQRTVGWRISGRVQGVGFRYFTRREATRLGVAGWVRNEADGTVSVVASGRLGELEALKRRLREGSPASMVADLEEREADGDFGWNDFRVTY